MTISTPTMNRARIRIPNQRGLVLVLRSIGGV
jgi:hypothetical protein